MAAEHHMPHELTIRHNHRTHTGDDQGLLDAACVQAVEQALEAGGTDTT